MDEAKIKWLLENGYERMTDEAWEEFLKQDQFIGLADEHLPKKEGFPWFRKYPGHIMPYTEGYLASNDPEDLEWAARRWLEVQK